MGKRGFTLIELLIVCMIIIISVITIASVTLNITSSDDDVIIEIPMETHENNKGESNNL